MVVFKGRQNDHQAVTSDTPLHFSRPSAQLSVQKAVVVAYWKTSQPVPHSNWFQYFQYHSYPSVWIDIYFCSLLSLAVFAPSICGHIDHTQIILPVNLGEPSYVCRHKGMIKTQLSLSWCALITVFDQRMVNIVVATVMVSHKIMPPLAESPAIHAISDFPFGFS